jgi:hypothetical protein
MAAAFSQFIYPYFYAQLEYYAPSLMAAAFMCNLMLTACAVFLLLKQDRAEPLPAS